MSSRVAWFVFAIAGVWAGLFVIERVFDPPPVGFPTRVVDGRRVWVIEPYECDDQSSCAAGVEFGGAFWSLTRGQVRPEFTTGELIAVGSPDVGATEARRIQFPDGWDVAAVRRADGWVPVVREEPGQYRAVSAAFERRMCEILVDCTPPPP